MAGERTDGAVGQREEIGEKSGRRDQEAKE